MVQARRIVDVGPPDAMRARYASADTLALGGTLIVPAMVNAHAHLDLTALGRRPMTGDFIDWVDMVMRERPQSSEAIRAAVRDGLTQSAQAGVGWIGDIAGSDAAVEARWIGGDGAWPGGVSFLECFGIGRAADDAARRAWQRYEALASQCERAVVGLQPHAPYSAGDALYEMLSAHREIGASTHLAETAEENEFVQDATGPFASLLQRLGKWDDTIRGHGVSAVGRLRRWLEDRPWVVAHGNYVDDADLDLLSRCPVSIAYCPVASEYFGHRDHRYRDMLEAGINVCLGTDSIVCQRPDAAQPLGIVDQMRRLHELDGTDPWRLLAMATTNGAKALGLEEGCGTLRRGAPARLVALQFDARDATDPLTQVLRNNHPARALQD